MVRHKERFRHDVSDVEWLTLAGREGWIVLTRDKHIRLREIERRALMAASVAAFVYTAGNASGVEVTEAILSALLGIEAVTREVDPPFIYRITAGGGVEAIFPSKS